MIKPYYQDKWVTIYHGDCREILPQLSNIDLVITSPPYNCGNAYESNNDAREWTEYWRDMQQIIGALYDILNVGGRVCWNGQLNIRRKGDIRVNLLQHFKNIFDEQFIDMGDILWLEYTRTKQTAWGSWCSPSSPYLQMPAEFICIYAKETTKMRGTGADITPKEFMSWVGGMWRFNGVRSDKHPSPFPEDIPMRCMKLFGYKDSLILDPFLGSGTTCYCAKKLNRYSIGIEIEEKYCEIAARRCSQEVMELFNSI